MDDMFNAENASIRWGHRALHSPEPASRKKSEKRDATSQEQADTLSNRNDQNGS